MLAPVAILLSGLAATVLGHGMVTTFKTDGVQNQGFILDYYYAKKNGQKVPDISAWYAENLDSGFVAPNNYGTQDINCHINATPGTLSTTVSAGGKVEFQWPATWPHPYGPILTYVAKCPGDCTKADKSQLKWVKIEAVGSKFPMPRNRPGHQSRLANPSTNSQLQHPEVGVPDADRPGRQVDHHCPQVAGRRKLRLPARDHRPARRRLAQRRAELPAVLQHQDHRVGNREPLGYCRHSAVQEHRPWYLLQPLHHHHELRHARPSAVDWLSEFFEKTLASCIYNYGIVMRHICISKTIGRHLSSLTSSSSPHCHYHRH